ncbi:MAG: molybdenum cofactor biosynthesis protein MoaE [Rubrivivax sp.]
MRDLRAGERAGHRRLDRRGQQAPRNFSRGADATLLELRAAAALDNINTPEEYQQARARLGGDGPRAPRPLKVRYFALAARAGGPRRGIARERRGHAARAVRRAAGAPRRKLAPEFLRVAVNDDFGSWSQALEAGDTVTFLPPVVRGRSRGRFRLQDTPIVADARAAGLTSPANGGYVSFEGWVRDHNEGRAVRRPRIRGDERPGRAREGERIIAEACARFGVAHAVCVHRVGGLDIGELAVWVGVAGGHRDEAFRACRYKIIDEVKHRVPIWKKEPRHGDWPGQLRALRDARARARPRSRSRSPHEHAHRHEHDHGS